MDISLEEKGKILLKYVLENEDTFTFKVEHNEVVLNKVKENENDIIFDISHDNIIFVDKNNNTIEPNFKVTYLIRLFNVLDYYDQDEIDNILFPKDLSIKSFRKEISDEEYINGTKYSVHLGKLEKGQYYISILLSLIHNLHHVYHILHIHNKFHSNFFSINLVFLNFHLYPLQKH